MPLSPQRINTTGWLVPWIGPFLGALSEGRPVTQAARIAKITPQAVYAHRRSNRDFRAAWRAAVDLGTSLLEEEAYRRAYHGVEEPVFYQGSQCGTIRRHSDGMLQFLLKARKPEMYRDMVEQGKGGVNVSIQANIAAVDLLRKQLTAGEVIDGDLLSQKGQIPSYTIDSSSVAPSTNNGQQLSAMEEITPDNGDSKLPAITDNSGSKCDTSGIKPIVTAGPSGPAPC